MKKILAALVVFAIVLASTAVVRAQNTGEISGVVAVVKDGEVIKSITVTRGTAAVAIVLNDAGKALAAKAGQEVTVYGNMNDFTKMFELLPKTDTIGVGASAMASGEASARPAKKRKAKKPAEASAMPSGE